MSGLQEAKQLREAGFEDPEIAQWATEERAGLQEVGFTEEEINNWFGERPPNTAKANSALARAVSRSIGRAGQGVADLATIYGPVEAALHAASGLIAGFPAYLGAGIGALIARGTGLSDDDPKEIATKFAELVTYKPMTAAGERTAQSLMLPFTLLTEAGETLGHKVTDAYNQPGPALAAARKLTKGSVFEWMTAEEFAAGAGALTESAVAMLPPPLLVSLGRRMAGKAPTEQTMKDAAAAIAKDQPEAAAPLEAKLRNVYEETGVDPVVVYDYATKDPKVLENLVADNRDPVRLFAQSQIEPTARMALREELQSLEAARGIEDTAKLADVEKRIEEIRAELGPRQVSDTLPAERPGESVEMPPKGWGSPSKETLLAEAQARMGPQPGHFGVEILTAEQHAEMAARTARAHADVLAKDEQIRAYQEELQAKGLAHPEVRPIMETMAANELGWAQIGGRHLGGPMGTPNFSTWIPRAEWWRERPDKKMNEAATRAAVQKAIAGQTLKPIEKRAVDHMLAIAQTRAAELKRLGEKEWNEAAGAAREQGLEPTTQNVVEVDLVARAAALDEAAVERAALQFEGDEAGFLSAIKGIVDERTSATTAGRGEGAARAPERPGAATPAPEPASSRERPGAPTGEHTGPIAGLTDLPRSEQPAAIGRAIEERLRATGVDEAEAKANGAVWEAFFASAGERYNLDPAALLERYMVSIEAGELPSPAAAGILRQEGVAGPLWYSELAKQIDVLPTERIPPEGLTAKEWKRVLIEPESKKRVAIRDAKNKPTGETKEVTTPEHPALPGVKADEIKWSGIEEWLDVQEGKVTKDQVAAFLKEGGIKIEEIRLGERGEPSLENPIIAEEVKAVRDAGFEPAVDPMDQSRVAFIDYREGGGDIISAHEIRDYAVQELSLVDAARAARAIEAYWADETRVKKPVQYAQGEYQLPGGQNYRELLLKLPMKGVEFRSPHFGGQHVNTLAHIRFTDRVDAEGKKVLFVEEIQSDWAQKGKREGFQRVEGELPPNMDVQRMTAEDVEIFGVGRVGDWYIFERQDREPLGHAPATMTRAEAVRNLIADASDIGVDLADFGGRSTKGVPGAPFVGKTESWVALSLKRMIRWGAENGYDRIAWTTGEQQVTRYQSALRKEVDSIEWTKTPEGVQLVGYKGRTIVQETAREAALARRDAEGTLQESGRQELERLRRMREAGVSNKVVDTTQKETDLSDAIGKAMADQIRNDPAQSGVIEGEGIRIDDTGMAAFYDRIVPNVANDVLKKLGGGRVSEVTLDLAKEHRKKYAGEAGPEPVDTPQQGFEITPALKEKALKGMPLFQEGEGAPRGQIEFGERGTIISLLENADRSTFLHETGHFFLQVTRDLATGEAAPALARQDWKVLSDWLALEEGAEIPRAAHEKFAEGFEQYLAEGKAPSPALRSIFEQFRDWLLEIYTIVKDAGLSDDVRGVLDRMLSSQAERPASAPPPPPPAPPPRPPQSPPPSDPQRAVLERISTDPAIPRRYTWEEFYADVKDDLWPIKNLVDELRQGTALGTAEDPYKLARLTRGAFGRATQFLEHSPFEFKTLQNVGKSLKDVLAPVKDDLDGLRAYAVSRRSIELAERDIVTGVPLEEARAVVEQGQKYEAVLKDLQEYQDHVLAYMKDSGIFNDAQIVAMREANKDYVPFYRLMEDAEGQGGAGPGLSVRSPIKRIKGSERKIIDPLESIVKNTYLYTALADRNAVGQALVTLAERSGRGEELVQKVKQPVRPIEIMDEEMSRFLEAHGIEAPEDTLTVFRRNSLVPEHDQIVVFREGKREVYQVPEEVATAFKATDRETAGMLTQILAIPARMLRAGATLSPDFISRNPVRDQFSAYVLSKSGYVPVLDLARGFVSIAKHDAEFQAWLKSGGANSAMLALDRDYVQTALAKHTGQLGFYDKTWNIVKNPLEPLRIVSELMENATRVGEFKKALEGMTKEEIQAAGYESREVTLDFARLGARTRSLNMITAFWNAQLEGMDRVVRAIHDRPLQSTIAIATSITLPSVLLWWANHDDPRWKEIPNWQRDLFWIVLTEDHIYRIPKPFELGVIFGSSVERILDAFYDEKPDSFKDFSSTMVNTMGLNFMPTVAAPVVGQIVNWNFFTDRPLVSSSMEKLLPEYQYSSYTTQATRALGHIIGAIPGMHDKSAASPMIIDNYIRAWTGTLGVYALQTADLALRKTGVLPDPIRPASTLPDMPVLRGFMVRYPSGQAQSIQDFYDSYQKATKVLDTIRHLARQGDAEAALREASIDPDKMVRLKGIQESLGNAQRTIQLVDSNPNFPPEEKRQLIDTIYYQMIAMAGAGNATLREMKRALEAVAKDRAALDRQFRDAGFTEAEIKAYREKTAPNPAALELVR